MKILGINAFAQNPAACLIIDGTFVGFSHEERFNRLKCSHGLFPSHSVNWLLAANKLKLSEIDIIAFNWDCNKYPWKRVASLLKMKVRKLKCYFAHPYKLRDDEQKFKIMEILKERGVEVVDPFVGEEKILKEHGVRNITKIHNQKWQI